MSFEDNSGEDLPWGAPDLIGYVNGSPSGDFEFASTCLVAAIALVARYCGEEEIHLAQSDPALSSSGVPKSILRRAVLEVGSELFHRRQAPNGIAQFATDGGAPIRVARDPMVAARPLLAPYLGVGIA